jgi:hypothetical protein
LIKEKTVYAALTKQRIHAIVGQNIGGLPASVIT